MDKIMDKVCKSLEDIDRSDNWSPMNEKDRKAIMELVDLKKNILKVEKLEDEMDGGASMLGAPGGYSGRRHYVRAHYSRAGDSSSRRDSRGRYSSDGYSMAEARDEMIDHMESAMSAAPDEHTYNKIRDFKERLERM